MKGYISHKFRLENIPKYEYEKNITTNNTK